ncbi:hypothetical protein GOV05_03130 [Candidatus Woesearchaeota archaeon]|nr:hypothetical protein [Candidatus Woesearchaeota archaeon]
MKVFLSKKGEGTTMTLQELIKILLGLMTFFLIVGFLVGSYKILTHKEDSLQEKDFRRVKKNLESLTIDSESFSIPIFSNNMVFETLKSAQKIRRCPADTECLCYRTPNTNQVCEKIMFSDSFRKVMDFKPDRNIIPLNHTIRLELRRSGVGTSEKISVSLKPQ